MKILRSARAAAFVLLVLAPTLDAQAAWETPRLIGPESPGGLGMFWLRSSALGPELDGGMAIWSLPGMGGSVALRGGAAVDPDDDVAAFGGVDIRSHVATHTQTQPLDVVWNAGIGAGSRLEEGQHVVVTVPMSIAAGRSWTSGAIWLAPYLSIGVAMDVHFGQDAPDDEVEVYPSADVGLDFALDPGRNFVIRVATSLGDRQALAVGLNLGGSRAAPR